MRAVSCVRARRACVWCQSACGGERPNRASPRAEGVPLPARTAPQSPDCVRVRSHRGPRLCAEGARLRGRSPPRLARARGRFRAAVTPRGCLRTLRVRLRRIFPPKASLSSAHSRLPVRLGVRASSAHERHPAWSEYLPSPPAAPCRRCAHPAARARSGPVPALHPLARYRHMSVSAVRVPRTLK